MYFRIVATYLLTYNPEKGTFANYDEAVRLTSKGQPYPELRTVLGPDKQPVPWPLPGREYTGPYQGPFASGTLVSDETAEAIESSLPSICPLR
jgi:hypothetical protein